MGRTSAIQGACWTGMVQGRRTASEQGELAIIQAYCSASHRDCSRQQPGHVRRTDLTEQDLRRQRLKAHLCWSITGTCTADSRAGYALVVRPPSGLRGPARNRTMRSLYVCSTGVLCHVQQLQLLRRHRGCDHCSGLQSRPYSIISLAYLSSPLNQPSAAPLSPCMTPTAAKGVSGDLRTP